MRALLAALARHHSAVDRRDLVQKAIASCVRICADAPSPPETAGKLVLLVVSRPVVQRHVQPRLHQRGGRCGHGLAVVAEDEHLVISLVFPRFTSVYVDVVQVWQVDYGCVRLGLYGYGYGDR